MGVPLVIIHFNRIFFYKPTILDFGDPPFMELPIYAPQTIASETFGWYP